METSEPVIDGQPEFNDDIEVVEAQKNGTLNILLVSDIHLAFDQLQLLLNWHYENGRKQFDFVFASGDLANISYDVSKDPKSGKSEEIEAEQEITKILLMLEKFDAPIFYIPGNHDPKSLFFSPDQRPTLSENSQNLHKTWVEIRPNLALVALGGSCPSFFQKHGEISQTPIYFPYPYSTDEMFQKDLQPLLSQVTSSQMILMTHDGPQSSSTTQDKSTRSTEGVINFGSQYLNKVLTKSQEKILANIHGHAHDGAPLDKISNLRIMNPGSLKFGEFAELLLKENADGSWRIAQYNKHYLE